MMEDSNAYIITISLVIQGFEITICVIKLSGWISWWGGCDDLYHLNLNNDTNCLIFECVKPKEIP